MILSNEELKKIYFGAYNFTETEDGFLMAHQYTKEQEEYFKGAFDFWYERCNASTSKTFEFTTNATKVFVFINLIILQLHIFKSLFHFRKICPHYVPTKTLIILRLILI